MAAGGVYSVRFIRATGIGPFTYTCPTGKRAIIKCLTAMNGTGAALGASLDIAGIYIWYGSIPGTSTLVQSGLHIVMNAGERLAVGAVAAGCHFTVSGYELLATP